MSSETTSDRALSPRLALSPRVSTVAAVCGTAEETLGAPAPKSGRSKVAGPVSSRDPWSRVRGGSPRWFGIALIIALLAHLPALPFDPLFLARILLHTQTPPPPDTPESHEVLVPIDLDLEANPPRTEDAPQAAPAAEPPKNDGPGSNDAPSSPATPAPATPAADSKPSTGTPAPAAKTADDIYDDLDTPKTATPTLKDPLAVAGGPGKIGPKDAFVQVLFNGNRLRGNTAGAALGGVLTALPEWKSFFDGTTIDPIDDAEHLLIAGPQFRRSKDVVVWMQYRVPEAEMKAAIDTLVKRTKGGKWLDDAPIPAAIAKAHQYKRIFALVPNKKLLVILPVSAKDQLAKAKTVRPFNATSRSGIVISLATPRNAFAGYEEVIDVPKTYKWLRMVVTPLAGGGADVALEIADASPADAAKHGPELEKQLSQVRTLAKLATVIGADVLPPMSVVVDRDILRVNATVSQKGLNHILNLARTHFAKTPAPDAGSTKDAKDDEEATDKKEKKGDAAVPPSGVVSTSAPSASTIPSSAPTSPSSQPSAKPSAGSPLPSR